MPRGADVRVYPLLFILLLACGDVLFPLPGREGDTVDMVGEADVGGAMEAVGTSADALEEPVTAEPAGQAGDASEQSDEPGADLIVLTGRVAIKGNAPHTMVVLTTASETGKKVDYQLVGPLSGEIGRKYQNRTVRLQGRIVRDPLGPGFPAQFEVFAVEQP